jgi:hypothetical protein
MESILPIVAVMGVVTFAILLIVWHYSRSSSLLQQWADQHGYRILHQEYRTFFKGPFFWTASKGQTVYYVTVEDQDGRRRNAWVRCGGYFLGLLSDKVDFHWDE